MIFSDKTLSQRIERAEARSNTDFVESHAKLFPESGAEWIEISGVYAMFDGADSPSTQTFGLGMLEKITNTEIDKIEAFFRQRGAPIIHEVSPMADPSVFSILNERGYKPVEFTNVLYQELDLRMVPVTDSEISSRVIREDEVGLFAEISTQGWIEEMPEYSAQMLEFSRIGALSKHSIPFIAELNDEPVATGTLYVFDEVAQLAGASTIPLQRKKGAQTVLLAARLRYAIENGCTTAIMGALPGSQSQRNAEKNGFRVAYTRTKWRLGTHSETDG